MYGNDYMIWKEADEIAGQVRDLAKRAYMLVQACEADVRDEALKMLGGNVVLMEQSRALAQQQNMIRAAPSEAFQSAFTAQASAGNLARPLGSGLLGGLGRGDCILDVPDLER